MVRSITLAGRLLTDKGDGVNAATVNVYEYGGVVSIANTTTQLVNGENGWWRVQNLDPFKIYRVVVAKDGKSREISAASEAQFRSLTVGKGAMQVDETGLTKIAFVTAPTNGAAVTSPALQFVGAYDDDPSAAVNIAERAYSIRNKVSADGKYKLEFLDNGDVPRVWFDETGIIYGTDLVLSAGTVAFLNKAQTWTVKQTFQAAPEFAPSVAGVPFTLTANAQGQMVTGLDADMVDGKHAADLALKTDLDAYAPLVGGLVLGTQVKTATGNLLLTKTYQDIPGCTINVGAGTYTVEGIFDFQDYSGGAFVADAQARLLVNGVAQAGEVNTRIHWLTPGYVQTSFKWLVTIPADQTYTVKFQAKYYGHLDAVMENGNVMQGTTRLIVQKA